MAESKAHSTSHRRHRAKLDTRKEFREILITVAYGGVECKERSSIYFSDFRQRQLVPPEGAVAGQPIRCRPVVSPLSAVTSACCVKTQRTRAVQTREAILQDGDQACCKEECHLSNWDIVGVSKRGIYCCVTNYLKTQVPKMANVNCLTVSLGREPRYGFASPSDLGLSRATIVSRHRQGMSYCQDLLARAFPQFFVPQATVLGSLPHGKIG